MYIPDWDKRAFFQLNLEKGWLENKKKQKKSKRDGEETGTVNIQTEEVQTDQVDTVEEKEKKKKRKKGLELDVSEIIIPELINESLFC